MMGVGQYHKGVLEWFGVRVESRRGFWGDPSAVRYFLIFISILSGMGISPRPARANISQGAEFSFRLFKALAASKESENFVFSPYGVRAGLGMASAGARGRTQRQLGKAPEPWVQKKDPSYKLLLANRLWVDMKYSLNGSFMEASEKAFGVRPWMVDFSKAPDFLCDRINGWVEERTSGKIRTVISVDSIETTDRMILNSAVYFKGEWVSPFSRSETVSGKFVGKSGNAVQIPLIRRTGNFLYYKGYDFQLVELPYLDGEISIELFLPDNHTTLSNFESNLKPEIIETWLNSLVLKEVSISLPKFTFESNLELSKALQSIGVTDAFDSGVADFSGMTMKKGIYLDHVIHKTQISFTEEGTESSSGNAAQGRAIASVPVSPTPFQADHPFVFLIRHRGTNSSLFMGHFVEPLPPVLKN